jgi:hypothetical protein
MKKLIVTLAFAFLCLGQQSAFAAAAAAFKVSPISSFAPLSKTHELALAQRKISARITVQGKPKIEFPWGVITLEKRDATTIISLFYNDNRAETVAEIKFEIDYRGKKFITFRLTNDFNQLVTVGMISLEPGKSHEFILNKDGRELIITVFGDQRDWTATFDPSTENLPNCFQDFDNDPYEYSDLEKEEEEKSNHADSAPNQRALALPDISAKFGQSSHYASAGEPRAKSSSHSSRSSGSSRKRPSTRTPQSPIESPRSSNASTGRSSGSAASISRSHSQQESERSISEQPLAPGMSPVYWVLSPVPLGPSPYFGSVSPYSADPSPAPVGPSPYSHAASPAPMPFLLGASPAPFFQEPRPRLTADKMFIHPVAMLAAQGIQLPQDPGTPHPKTNVWLP